MANVLNRSTKEYRKFVNTPDYSPALWIINPDISAVEGWDTKYWVITGDDVTLMDQAARDAVDAGEASAQLAADRNEAQSRADVDIFDRALVSELLFEINKLNTRMTEVHTAFAAIKATSGGSDNIRGAIPANFLGITEKLRSQILQGIIDRIDAGEGDP